MPFDLNSEVKYVNNKVRADKGFGMSDAIFKVVDPKIFTKDLLNDRNAINQLTQEIVENVAETVNSLHNSGHEIDGKAFSKNITSKVFDNIKIDDKEIYDADGLPTVTEQINKIEFEQNFKFDEEMRVKVGSLLLAQSQLNGYAVSISGNLLVPNVVSVAPEMDWLDKIFAFLGIYTDKVKATMGLNAVVDTISQIKDDEIKKTAETAKKQKIIEDNKEFVKPYIKKFANFCEQRAQTEMQIDKLYFGSLDPQYFPQKQPNGPFFKGLNNTETFRSRSALTLAACMMLNDGHTLENICDPDYQPQTRVQIGQRIVDLVANLSGKDAKAKETAEKDLTEIYLEGGKKFLQQSMPDEEELDNFTDSKRAYYLSSIGHIPFDLGQEFEVQKNGVITKNPANNAVYQALDVISRTGKIGAITTTRQKMFNNSVKENNQQSRSAGQDTPKATSVLCQIALAQNLKFEHKNTIYDYVKTNREKAMQWQAFTEGVSTNISDVYINNSKSPVELQKIVDGNMSVIDVVANDTVYNAFKENVKERYNKIGEFDLNFARADLANDIAKKMNAINDNKYTTQQINNMATEIRNNEVYISMTEKDPETVKSYINNMAFLQDYNKNVHQDNVEKAKGTTINQQISAPTESKAKQILAKSKDVKQKEM